MNLGSRVRAKEQSCIGDTRKLNRVLVTECLLYIHLANSLYYTKPSLL